MVEPRKAKSRRPSAGSDCEVPLEVADDGVHLEPRILARDRVRAADQHLLAHVERDETTQGSLGDERVQQEPCLLGRSRAQLDERLRVCLGRDLGCPLLEDPALRPREVVAGEPSDLVEQKRASLVVEPDRRDLLRPVAKAAERLRVERCPALGVVEKNVDANAHRPVYASRAQRKPAKIWRRSGKSQLRKLDRATTESVAHDPPRRTRYSSPKKTSENSGYGKARNPG